MSNRGLIRSIWNYFTKVRVADKKVKVDFLGTDKHGNKYYLKHPDPVNRKKATRFVLPSDDVVETYEERMGMDIPQEWDAWLRRRRENPPTEEEIERNERNKKKIQEKVKELERKERLERGELPEADIAESTVTQTITKTVTGDTTKTAFPTYDDLELTPGAAARKPKLKD